MVGIGVCSTLTTHQIVKSAMSVAVGGLNGIDIVVIIGIEIYTKVYIRKAAAGLQWKFIRTTKTAVLRKNKHYIYNTNG